MGLQACVSMLRLLFLGKDWVLPRKKCICGPMGKRAVQWNRIKTLVTERLI